MTTWFIAEHPTPQRVPTFNAIAAELPAARFLYMNDSDYDRGWGDIAVAHPAIYWNRLCALEKLRVAWAIFTRSRDDAAVAFGYRGIPRLSALIGSRLRGAPIVVRSDTNQRIIQQQRQLRRWVRRLVIRTVVPRTATAWTIGTENERFWREEIGLKHTKRIPYETPLLPGYRTWQSIRVRRTDPSAVRVICVGRLVPLKRINDVIEAFSNLHDNSYSAWELLIIGDGPEYSGLAKLAQADPRVGFAGSVPYEELGDIFEASDVLAMPSAQENWGLVINEALGFGLYVIASDTVGAAIDLIREGNGRLVEVGNEVAWQSALASATAYLDRIPTAPGTNTGALMLVALRQLAEERKS